MPKDRKGTILIQFFSNVSYTLPQKQANIFTHSEQNFHLFKEIILFQYFSKDLLIEYKIKSLKFVSMYPRFGNYNQIILLGAGCREKDLTVMLKL